MSAIRLGGKMLGGLALAGVIGAGVLLLGCGRSETPAQSASAEQAPATAATPAAAATDAEAPAGHAQTNCPILGGAINKAIFVDYQGKRVYFCCGGCPAQFNKDPAKYVKALEDQGVVLDKTPQ